VEERWGREMAMTTGEDSDEAMDDV